jgi:tRNA-specific 2-thiouridylase
LGKLSTLHDGKISVEFMANVSGVAPGQSAVFYEGDDVVGGGIIHSSLLLQ